MKTMILFLLLTLSNAIAEENPKTTWILEYRGVKAIKHQDFSSSSAAMDWIEHHREYQAIKLTHDKVIRPCHTREDDGSSAHSRLITCWTDEEFKKSFFDYSPGNTY